MRYVIAVALILVAVFAFAPAAGAVPPTDQANNPSTYEGGPHEADCYKHEPGDYTPHGYISQDGKSVVLNTFDQSWPGDHWETLVVKGGDGRTIQPHPNAGQAYSAPLNNGGNVPDVSHWIVCKGTTPDQPEKPDPFEETNGVCVGLNYVTTSSGYTWTFNTETWLWDQVNFSNVIETLVQDARCLPEKPDPFEETTSECVGLNYVTTVSGYTWEWSRTEAAWVQVPYSNVTETIVQDPRCLPEAPEPFEETTSECVGLNYVTTVSGYTWEWNSETAQWEKSEYSNITETVTQDPRCIPEAPEPDEETTVACVSNDLVTTTTGYTWEWNVEEGAWEKNYYATSSTVANACLAETGAPDSTGLAATAGSLVALGTVALLARRRLA